MSLAQGLERAIERLTLVGAVGIALTAGFLLCLFGFFIGIGAHIYNPWVPGKEVGFLHAPNWTIVYMVLFPLYLSFFSTIVSSIKAFFNSSLASPELRVITGPGGVPVDLNLVTATWNAQLRRLSTLLFFLGFAVIISSALQWFVGCFEPYARAAAGQSDFLQGEVWDWSTVPYLRKTGAQAALAFTAVAYSYMAFALFVYLAILAYCAYFATFMSLLADDTDDKLRLVIRGNEPRNFLAEMFTYIYTISFLGLCAAYFMRLQALYLNSNQIGVFEYQFTDFRCLVFGRCSSVDGLQMTASFFTSLLEAAYTLIMLVVSVLMLSKTYSQSKRYYLQKIGDPNWRRTMRIRYEVDFISDLKKETFLEAVIPHYAHLAISLALLIAAILFPYIGSLFVASVLYALIALLRGNPNQWDRTMPQAEPEDSEHFKRLDISEDDKEEIVLLLEHEASTNPLSDKIYESLVKRAEIPEEYMNDIVGRIRSEDSKAEALVDAALNQGRNIPQFDKDKKNSTVLGSILLALKDGMGLELQCLIVSKLKKCQLVADQVWLGQLSAKTCGPLLKPTSP